MGAEAARRTRPKRNPVVYPPQWRIADSGPDALALIRAHPFALLVSAQDGVHATRIPFAADHRDGRLLHLRGHLNAANPQVRNLDGQDVLVVFDGPATYVSPNWRSDGSRAGTYDYEQVKVRGTVRVIDDIARFRALIDDLAAAIEPQYAEVGDYPVWQTHMAPEGYIERLYPAITLFRIDVAAVEMVSKLHQSFPEVDRRSIAEHLERSHRDDSRAIAARIRAQLGA
jgi:transcriptional regulator